MDITNISFTNKSPTQGERIKVYSLTEKTFVSTNIITSHTTEIREEADSGEA